MEIIEYIGNNCEDKKEISQINRIKDILISWAKNANLDKIWIFTNVNYYHKGLGLKWNHIEWNGEIDLLLISKNHFIIFELKNKKGVIKGQTQNGYWKIKYYDSNNYVEEKNYFIQCSRIKAFFSLNYYPKKVLPKIRLDYKLRPDILLIFLNGSDTSDIFFTPPTKFYTDEYYGIINMISNEDRKFMEENFHYEKKRDIININFNEERIDLKNLKRILDSCNYEDRISKWFHVLTEEKVIDLLPNLGSDSFIFNKEIIEIFVEDFKLKLSNEYVV